MKGITRVELDFITYWAGTKFLTLSDKHLKGPKCENCTNDFGKTINVMCKNKAKLKKIEKLKTKEIEAIIYNIEITPPA